VLAQEDVGSEAIALTPPITQFDIAEELTDLGFSYVRTDQLYTQLNPRFIRAGADVWHHPNNADLEVTVGVGTTVWASWFWRVVESGKKLAEGIGRISLNEYFTRYDELID